MHILSKFFRLVKKFGLRKAIYRSLIYVSSKKEDASYADYKQKYFKGINGDVVEIGVGYGSNFTYYGKIGNLTVIEPDIIERDDLRNKLERVCAKHYTLIEKPFEDASLKPLSADVIIATLLFCSIRDAAQLLTNIHETLKPGGKFFFLEHIRSKSRMRRMMQWIVNPLWRGISGRCQCIRATDTQLLTDNRFTAVSHEYFRTIAGFPWVKDHVIGVLEKK